LRQDALHHLGNILIDLDEFRPARTCFEEGLAICAHLGDEDGMAAELTGLGLVSRYLGDYDRSFAQFQRCLEIWTRHGSTWKTGITLHNLGNLEISRGAFEAADRFHAEALLLRRELGDAEGEAYSLFGLGAANFYLRQYADAADLYATSLRLFLEVGDAQGEAHARHGLGRVEHALGNDHLAAEHLRLALALRYEFRSRLGVAECLDLLAAIAARRDRHDRAARLIGAAVAIHDAIRWVEPDADRVARERVLAAIRRALGHQKSAAAVRDGKALPLSRAVGEALSLAVEAEAIPTAASAFGLTSRQVEVLRLLSQRLTDPEIAEALFVSPRTASFHVTSILRKLGVDNRREAAVLAAQHGLI
jgi:non-specific serine/threonine protein kinase